MCDDLHHRLVALQSDEELERKARKAVTRSNIWTQEELDAADREADRMFRYFEAPHKIEERP
jgi:hypothetical protein